MESQKSPARRSRGHRTKLKRNQEIEHCAIQDSFMLYDPTKPESSEDYKVGEAAYIQCTINTTRYYGMILEQNALRAASMLHFQNEGNSLELNRRMKALKAKHEEENGDEAILNKRLKVDDAAIGTGNGDNGSRQIQKFVYIEDGSYRKLLATYADLQAAGEDDSVKEQSIKHACESGGNFVGKYYYQFEEDYHTLKSRKTSRTGDEMRMSMGLHDFMRSTAMPTWFPLSNLQVGQQKVLNILSMKKDSNGNVVWDKKANEERERSVRIADEAMEQRSRYRIIVVGGGIAGLSASLELLKQCDQEKLDVEVVLLEGRDRLGGRLSTDGNIFSWKGEPFPVDLGASWIHGIEGNPLTSLAKEAGATFVTTSEDVKMMGTNMKEVDPVQDTNAGDLFDKLLDIAADRCWTESSKPRTWKSHQAAVRWYAEDLDATSKDGRTERLLAPIHRWSTDTNVDYQLGNAISKKRAHSFAALTESERRMLLWNAKNIEYALGADLKDLSMKFWDIDERNAFGGEHVMIKQGYCTIVSELLRQLSHFTDRFLVKTKFTVSKIEYDRNTTTRPFVSSSLRQRKLVELSDKCRVVSETSETVDGDFVVSALPLGVLKNAILKDGRGTLKFQPELPVCKIDSISNVGFGLLNKVFVQFSTAFWRNMILSDDQTSFGNATGIFPQYYMFFDVGKAISENQDGPGILMTLVSGSDAVDMEKKSDDQVVNEIKAVLQAMIAPIELPDCINSKVTRWGSDRFSRGSYTYLPPGTTDDDFQLLQSPVNENGDSLLLESSETMRLFFAGEHTSSLHPSLAHGALLSGMRAAQEIISTITYSLLNDERFDRIIPMPLFRSLNPKSTLQCSLCSLPGTRVREGTLLAFKRGAKEVLVHNNCAEFCPEVEVIEGKWINVLQACNRGKSIKCTLCCKPGATVGCNDHCGRSYHFSCAEDTGWRFEEDGKEFRCHVHRSAQNDCRRVSTQFLNSEGTKSDMVLACTFCGRNATNAYLGKLIAFKKGQQGFLVHQKCVRRTNIVEIKCTKNSRFADDYSKDIMTAINRSGLCSKCYVRGASVKCAYPLCEALFHFPCICELGIRISHEGKFHCPKHTGDSNRTKEESSHYGGSLFNHALFTSDHTVAQDVIANDRPANSEALSTDTESDGSVQSVVDDAKQEKRASGDGPLDTERLTGDAPLDAERLLVRRCRNSRQENWGIQFSTEASSSGRYLTIYKCTDREDDDPYNTLEKGDIVVAINGLTIGSDELDSIDNVVRRLGQEVDILIEIARGVL